MARTLLNLKIKNGHSIRNRKTTPNLGGIKLPSTWEKLADRVGAFRIRRNYRTRLGIMDRYATALRRIKIINRRKRQLKITIEDLQTPPEDINFSIILEPAQSNPSIWSYWSSNCNIF